MAVMIPSARRFLSPILLLVALLLTGAPALAHPADEAAVFHYLWLEARPGEVSLQHATVAGGLVTNQVWPMLDPNGDREISQAEQEKAARKLAESLSLEIDGRPVAWKLEAYEFPSHAEFFGGSFPATKLLLTAPLPKMGAAGHTLRLRDETYSGFQGIFPEPVVRTTGLSAAAPVVSPDGRRTSVKLSLFQGPETPSGLSGLRITPEGSDPLGGLPEDARPSPSPAAQGTNAPPSLDRELDSGKLFPERGAVVYAAPESGDGHGEETGKLKGLLGRPLGLLEILLGLGAALLAGAVHALSPGHGKAMVGAYLVGTRGTVRDAILLGLVVTVTHTAGIYLLGFLLLWLTSRVQTEVIGHWLSLASGLLVLGMGFWLFQRGLLHYHGVRPMPGHAHGPGGHTHGGEWGSGAVEEREVGHAHAHAHDGHSHSHSHAGAHTHGHAHAHSPSPSRRPPSDSPLEDGHGRGDSEREARPSRWGIIGLGVAGGMVPCFDALAILVAAVNLGSVAIGLALIAAFSVGMAAVLVAIGIVLVKARDLVRAATGEAHWIKAMPAVSGAVLFFLGAWLTLQALVQAGIVRVG